MTFILIISVAEEAQVDWILKLLEAMNDLWFDRDSEGFDNILMKDFISGAQKVSSRA